MDDDQDVLARTTITALGDAPLELARRLFGEEPDTIPGRWYIGNTGAWYWRPDPEGE